MPVPMSGRPLTGMACVSNLGSYANWTGHVLAGSNTYGFGRLSWDPTQSAESINREWAAMTFPLVVPLVVPPAPESPPAPSAVDTVDTVTDILQRSRGIYEGYTSPLGIGFIVFGGYDRLSLSVYTIHIQCLAKYSHSTSSMKFFRLSISNLRIEDTSEDMRNEDSRETRDLRIET